MLKPNGSVSLRFRKQRKAVVSANDKKMPNGILEEQGRAPRGWGPGGRGWGPGAGDRGPRAGGWGPGAQGRDIQLPEHTRAAFL